MYIFYSAPPLLGRTQRPRLLCLYKLNITLDCALKLNSIPLTNKKGLQFKNQPVIESYKNAMMAPLLLWVLYTRSRKCRTFNIHGFFYSISLYLYLPNSFCPSPTMTVTVSPERRAEAIVAQRWGPARKVTLRRIPGEPLGVSIVGGKVRFLKFILSWYQLLHNSGLATVLA